MSLFPQLLLDTHDELIADLFAGGGGASAGIEMATGRMVDVAINHDEAAVALHEENHPTTRHHRADVFEVDPVAATQGRPVGLLWASPDCTYYSKARGGKPIRSKHRKRRSLAWVVTRWAGQVGPRVIILENVEEFTDWGPLVAKRDPKTGRVVKGGGQVAAPGEQVPLELQQLVPCPARAARRFRAWKRSLRRLGYQVEHRQLRASDYGTPTIRKRLFVIARRDGEPIVWPTPTHGSRRGMRPERAAGECIDWSQPMLSIFAGPDEATEWARAWRKAGMKMGTPRRPLADATLRRVARGAVKYVIESANPFLVNLAQRGPREYPLDESLRTQHAGGNAFGLVSPYIVPNNTNNAPHDVRAPIPTVTGGGRHILAAPYFVPRYGEREGQEPRGRSVARPHPVIVPTGNGGTLVSAFLAKHYGGVVGSGLDEPKGAITTIDHDSVVAATLAKLRGASVDADAADPLHTVSAQGTHHGLIAAHLQRDFGASVGGSLGDPVGTLTGGGGGKAALVYAFLQTYYGEGIGQSLADPLRTVTTKDRISLVTVTIGGLEWVVVDIALRMLQPHELYLCQGFPRGYRIQTRFWDSRREKARLLTKTEQVRMVGNSVPPPVTAALVAANCPELVARDAARTRRVG